MTEMISQRELRNDSGRVMRELDAGRSFIVTRNSQPVGELRPLRRARFARKDDLIEALRGLPVVDYEEFRADVDAHVDQGISHPKDFRGLDKLIQVVEV
ncbi:type II toxin-antitoxin system Phd/YefM family antitoxin [Corynebacterium aquatimens]|uniref:Antitoxin (DNA-binding transcriptional repressor) of toxin-antitoxin stability system n=1 Tax=Corynebacterium aquatimens TaxID=1190508 RepID=A0A931DXB2_9CORY|nr:prevent-host-death protein [Corynebacterium aquatimens]MBG6121820.1 antitoxin (DNA-binding transcriptional repressor) of toxin-antitoxin stability system [Corynebacterium aquatimens]WJY65642.1 hypothetical protein CAQUA_04645 [Corynebacterium aquatimens]